MPKRDWRVLYGSYDVNSANHTRSKPFDTEDQALAWAITWVKSQGAEIQPAAHVLHRTVTDGENEPDPTWREHRVYWVPVDDELRVAKRTWPSQSRAAHEAEMRRVMAGLGQPDSPKVYTTIEVVEDMPLRAL